MTIDRDRLGKALALLSDDVRAALELAVLDGLGYREIASLLDEREEAVATRLTDGLAQLRHHIGAGFVA